MTPPAALLDPASLDRLRAVFDDYTVDAVHGALGLAGRAAHERGDLVGTALALRAATAPAERTRTLIELFLLGQPVDEPAAVRAFGRDLLDRVQAGGMVQRSGTQVRAAVDVRPYGGSERAAWWVVSDLGSDVRPGPLPADHVLGVGRAALTLAQATPRDRVGSALDLGTGCGVQALHLGEHAARVTATDISERALAMAATTAGLSGQRWNLRAGSLLDPLAPGERFDLVVANPPFVISPGAGLGPDGLHTYRDSGLAGDQLTETLLSDLPAALAPGGTAVLLANWIVPQDGTWTERVTGWLTGRGCDAWIWQREVADLCEYVTLWLRDAGEQPGTPRWRSAYETWTRFLVDTGAAAIGMGLIALRQPLAADGPTVEIVAEDVPQRLGPGLGAEIPAWFRRRRWLATTSDAALLRSSLRAAPGLVRTSDAALDRTVDPGTGWHTVRERVRQPSGLCWEVEIDAAMAGVLAACDGTRPLGLLFELTRAVHGDEAVADDATATARDLVGRGILLPPTESGPGPQS